MKTKEGAGFRHLQSQNSSTLHPGLCTYLMLKTISFDYPSHLNSDIFPILHMRRNTPNPGSLIMESRVLASLLGHGALTVIPHTGERRLRDHSKACEIRKQECRGGEDSSVGKVLGDLRLRSRRFF